MRAILEKENYVPSLAMKQNALSKFIGKPSAIVFHTTGPGPHTRSTSNPIFPSPFDAAIHIYTHIMRESGHFVVCGDTGEWRQTVPLDTIAWTVGPRGYQTTNGFKGFENDKRWDWWRKTFPGLKNPTELAQHGLWANGSANSNSINIEIVPPSSGLKDPWSPQCLATLKYLADQVILFHGMDRFKENIISHSEASPPDRSHKNGEPWDPAPTQWDESVRDFIRKP